MIHILAKHGVSWTLTLMSSIVGIVACDNRSGASQRTATSPSSDGSTSAASSAAVAGGLSEAAPEPVLVSTHNQRYLTDATGKAVYLTGSHTWANFQDAGPAGAIVAFDYPRYLDFLVKQNHNFFRLWVWEQAAWAPHTTDKICFAPLPYARTGPGKGVDGEPRFDLTRFNQAYFGRLRDRVTLAGQRGIYVSVMLFNGFSVGKKGGAPGNPWPGHPYNRQNNINGIDGDADGNGTGDEVHTLRLKKVTALQEAYVRKVIDTVGDLDNVLYEISNESTTESTDWQNHMVEYIHTSEASKGRQHLVGMTAQFSEQYSVDYNGRLAASAADWISPGVAGGYKVDPPPADGKKISILDTDHLWGIGGESSWVYKSFMAGHNVLYMDCYDRTEAECSNSRAPDAVRVAMRNAMGHTRRLASRVNLSLMMPRPELASSRYCLAHSAATEPAYLVYLPAPATGAARVQVDLSPTPGRLMVEWVNAKTGESRSDGEVTGGGKRDFKAPFSGAAVLYLH